MNSGASSGGGGIGLLGLLGIVFIILKLTYVIDWSWWWVTAPLWGGAALGLAMIIVGGVLYGLHVLARGTTAGGRRKARRRI